MTVIVVNWNGGALLERCLRHLEAQSYSPRRILVVDNGSTDGSADRARQSAGVEVLSLGENIGFAAANNRALAECDTEFVALLNPDAFPEPAWLEHLVNAASANPDCGSFGSLQVTGANGAVIDGLGDVYHVSGAAWRHGYGLPVEADSKHPREIFSPCAAAALYRRDALVAAGGFDEDYFCYFEDVDLGFRLRLLGFGSMLVPEAVAFHQGSGITGGRGSDFSVFYGQRNLVWTYFKNMPRPYFWRYLPQHVLLNLAALLHFMLRGQGGVAVRAKWSALLGLPRAIRKRRAIQARMTASPESVRDAMLSKWLAPYRRRLDTWSS